MLFLPTFEVCQGQRPSARDRSFVNILKYSLNCKMSQVTISLLSFVFLKDIFVGFQKLLNVKTTSPCCHCDGTMCIGNIQDLQEHVQHNRMMLKAKCGGFMIGHCTQEYIHFSWGFLKGKRRGEKKIYTISSVYQTQHMTRYPIPHSTMKTFVQNQTLFWL